MTNTAHHQITTGLNRNDAWQTVTGRVFVFAGFGGLIAGWPTRKPLDRRVITCLSSFASEVLDGAGLDHDPVALRKS